MNLVQICNWHINHFKNNNKSLTLLNLMRLLFISQGWSLALRNTPLFEEDIEAWASGPIIPKVYTLFRPQGYSITKSLEVDENSNLLDVQFLEEIYKIYGSMSSSKLENLVKTSEGPWELALHMAGDYTVIPKELIKSHYKIKNLQAKLNKA